MQLQQEDSRDQNWGRVDMVVTGTGLRLEEF